MATPGTEVGSSPGTAFPRRSVLGWAVGLAALAGGILFALRIGGGAIEITWAEVFRWALGGEIDPTRAQALATLRLPRALMAAVSGATLATAGAVYQALLRNPLAEPYTLGVSGGATFGAVVAIALAGRLGPAGAAWLSLPVVSAAALAGAGTAIVLVYILARSAGRFSSSTIILAGITLNLVFASLILLVEYLADYTQVYEMIRWMMGGLDIVGYRDFQIVGPVAAIGLATIFLAVGELDLLAVDPLAAATLGVRVERARWRLLLAASLMTGCVVAFAGPIGFVGLIVPHCVRMALGAPHGRVMPACVVAGALFLIACDTLAQNVLGDEELPVGVITAMLGGPFFVFLLFRHARAGPGWGD